MMPRGVVPPTAGFVFKKKQKKKNKAGKVAYSRGYWLCPIVLVLPPPVLSSGFQNHPSPDVRYNLINKTACQVSPDILYKNYTIKFQTAKR